MHLPYLFGSETVLFADFFQLSTFQFLLARNAVARPWNCFQPFGVDLIAAVHTLANGAFTDALQRRLNHVEQLAVIVALGK